MDYNNLGRSGLKVSEMSFGSWLTFNSNLDQRAVKKLMHRAFEAGINFFDNAEVYAHGQSEVLMGEALKDFRRSELVISTKIFWGGKGPNQTGLSWKRMVEGTKAALQRLQVDYVDLLYCHRPDPETPIAETVRAIDTLIRGGYAFYWGTSEWSGEQIEEAYRLSRELNCIPPTMEQPQYHMFHRQKVEVEFAPLYEKYGMGTTTWSPLNSGILTGKYNSGIPKGTRLDSVEWLREELTPEKINKVKKLKVIADELRCSTAQLALAWCLKNPRVSTVILGATTQEQLDENLVASNVKKLLTDEIMERIEKILDNNPSRIVH